MTDAGRINGWDIKDMRVSYDQANDRLYVGVNFFGVAGDADGNGVVGTTDPRFGGQEHAHLGLVSHSDESITVGIDLTNSGKPTIVAGIAADKSIIGPGTDGFTVNWAKDAGSGLSGAYGADLEQPQRQPGLRALEGPPRLRVLDLRPEQDPRASTSTTASA